MTALNHAANAGRHALAKRKNDLYETPAVAVHALLRVERIPHVVWEPACGPGSIVTVLRNAGHDVIATDLVDYGCPDSASGRDFLMEWDSMWALPYQCKAIVTNPPYKLAEQFVAHALKLCPRVVMLLPFTFMEAKRPSEILDNGQLARVHVFRQRLPMMRSAGWVMRGAGWGGKKAGSSKAFAWFVWDRDHQGPPRLDQIWLNKETSA